MDQQQNVSQEPVYEVVWPLGKSTSPRVNLAPALTDQSLNGKTVCEFWGWVYRGDQMYPIINEELAKRFHGIKVIDHNTTGDSHGNNITEKPYLTKLPAILKEHSSNAVICGVGA